MQLLKEAGGNHSPPPSPIKKVKEVIEGRDEEEEKLSEPVSLDAQELKSVSIDMEEFESSRKPSRSLYVMKCILIVGNIVYLGGRNIQLGAELA